MEGGLEDRGGFRQSVPGSLRTRGSVPDRRILPSGNFDSPASRPVGSAGSQQHFPMCRRRWCIRDFFIVPGGSAHSINHRMGLRNAPEASLAPRAPAVCGKSIACRVASSSPASVPATGECQRPWWRQQRGVVVRPREIPFPQRRVSSRGLQCCRAVFQESGRFVACMNRPGWRWLFLKVCGPWLNRTTLC